MFKVSALLLVLVVTTFAHQEDDKPQADLVNIKEEFLPKSTTEEDEKLVALADDSETLEGEEARYYNRYGNWNGGGWNGRGHGHGYYNGGGGYRGGWNGYNGYRRRW